MSEKPVDNIDPDDEDFDPIEVIGAELNEVPVQKTALHKSKAHLDVEGFGTPINSLPDVTLAGGEKSEYEEEDGVHRSGKHCFQLFLKR